MSLTFKLTGPFFVAAAWCLFCPCSSTAVAGDGDAGEARRFADGVVARSQAVFSGRLEYELVAGYEKSNERLSFSGPSWALRYTNGNYHVSHAGKYVEFIAHPQPNGRILLDATVRPERPIDATFPSPPTFAGTFWYDDTRKFVRDHAGTVKLKGKKDIDGIETRVLEWWVGKHQLRAFGGMGDSLLGGGTLRVYAAPRLGYALPRMEYVGKDGLIETVYYCSDFREVAPGVHLPMKCGYTFSKGGGDHVSFRCEYTILKAEKINEPIPPEDFVMELPPGTYVQDIRGPQYMHFKVGQKQFTTKDLADVPAMEGTIFWRTWKGAVLIGLAVGLTLLAAYLLVVRRLRARLRTSS